MLYLKEGASERVIISFSEPRLVHLQYFFSNERSGHERYVISSVVCLLQCPSTTSYTFLLSDCDLQCAEKVSTSARRRCSSLLTSYPREVRRAEPVCSVWTPRRLPWTIQLLQRKQRYSALSAHLICAELVVLHVDFADALSALFQCWQALQDEDHRIREYCGYIHSQ